MQNGVSKGVVGNTIRPGCLQTIDARCLPGSEGCSMRSLDDTTTANRGSIARWRRVLHRRQPGRRRHDTVAPRRPDGYDRGQHDDVRRGDRRVPESAPVPPAHDAPCRGPPPKRPHRPTYPVARQQCWSVAQLTRAVRATRSVVPICLDRSWASAVIIHSDGWTLCTAAMRLRIGAHACGPVRYLVTNAHLLIPSGATEPGPVPGLRVRLDGSNFLHGNSTRQTEPVPCPAHV